ncbi:MAG TPA: helix-turn-helix domain-containing protein [Pirellulaceae bacterium]|nr:helix-turn-helix domain-containing protein [Pirellulaceae bacterium]
MNKPTLPLPRGWTNAVRAAVLHVIALAQFSLACAEGQLTRRKGHRGRLRAEHDRLIQELELVRQELRIKDARLSRLAPQKRPHYLPSERMAILQLRAARGWTVDETAAAFQVTPLTIREWMGRLETEGTERFLSLGTPVNKFPDFVREVVQRLKSHCPRLGKRKIAETLARAGLHLGATTVRRMLREFPKPKPQAASLRCRGGRLHSHVHQRQHVGRAALREAAVRLAGADRSRAAAPVRRPVVERALGPRLHSPVPHDRGRAGRAKGAEVAELGQRPVRGQPGCQARPEADPGDRHAARRGHVLLRGDRGGGHDGRSAGVGV